MAFKDGSGQIIKLLATHLAVIALPVSLMRMKTTLVDQLGVAIRAANPFGPAHLAHFFIAFLLVYQVINME